MAAVTPDALPLWPADRRTLRRGEEERLARLPGGSLTYVLRRSPRSRRLRVTLLPDRGVVVSVPPASRRGWAHPEGEVERFLAERERWVRRHLAVMASARAELAARGGVADGATVRFRGELHRLRIVPRPGRRSTVERTGGTDGDELVVRLATGDRRPVERVLREWLRERATTAIEREITRHAPALRVTPARVDVRDPRTRWGSASREGRIMLSWRLVLAPPEALETVVVHELAHLRVFGHGPAFWALVGSRRPDHADWRRWLRRHSLELHGALEA
jgi:predicted metal-dependent hydrolase